MGDWKSDRLTKEVYDSGQKIMKEAQEREANKETKTKTKLTLEIMKSFDLPNSTNRPDYDDTELIFELPNGMELSTLIVCSGELCEPDSLEGMDGYIYINTKEELEDLIAKDYDTVIEDIARDNEDFDKSEYV